LHLAEALATELSLTTERLLGDQRVRARRACVDLVVHEVVELQDVLVAHRDRLGERLTGAAVEQTGLAVVVHEALAVTTRRHHGAKTADGLLRDAVEDGRRYTGARGRGAGGV